MKPFCGTVGLALAEAGLHSVIPPRSVGGNLDIRGNAGYRVTTGIGSDLMQAVRDAVSGMIDWLCATICMAAVDEYMLCSVCADFRFSEIVDMPNWTVSFHFPKKSLG